MEKDLVEEEEKKKASLQEVESQTYGIVIREKLLVKSTLCQNLEEKASKRFEVSSPR